MALTYFQAYHSYLKSIEPLNDAEKGRLFTALLEYSSTGVVPQLNGNERFIFPTMKEQIDRDMAKYAATCERNKKNVSARWAKEGCDRIPNDTTVYDRIPNDTKNTKEKKKEKEKEKKKESISSSPLPPSSSSVSEAQKNVIRAFDRASGCIMSLAQQDELLSLTEDYGEERMIDAIRRAVDNCKDGVRLSYIRAVLAGKGKPRGDAGKQEDKPILTPELMQAWEEYVVNERY